MDAQKEIIGELQKCLNQAKILLRREIDELPGKTAKEFVIYRYNSRALNSHGAVVFNGDNSVGETIILKGLPQDINQLIRDIGATNTVFKLVVYRCSSADEKDHAGYAGWIAWHGNRYRIARSDQHTPDMMTAYIHGLRQLFLIIDRARRLEFLEQLFQRHFKALDAYILN